MGKAGWELTQIRFNDDVRAVFINHETKQVSVADEIYWNEWSATGKAADELIALAKSYGYEAGMSVTPYALKEFGGTATVEQLAVEALKCDFVILDPYLWKEGQQDALLNFTKVADKFLNANGIETIIIKQGFAIPGTEATVATYNQQLNSIGDTHIYGDAIDFPDIPDTWQIAELIGISI